MRISSAWTSWPRTVAGGTGAILIASVPWGRELVQIVELTLGASRKRPGPVPYSSDEVSAFVKIAIHPGDDYSAVVVAARAAVQRALNAEDAHAEPSPPPEPVTHKVIVGPPGKSDPARGARISELGLRWDRQRGAFVGEYLEARALEVAAECESLGLVAQVQRADPVRREGA